MKTKLTLYIVAIVSVVLLFQAKADGVDPYSPVNVTYSGPCVPYQDIDYCNPGMDTTPAPTNAPVVTRAVFPTVNPILTPSVMCTADCAARSVEVCIPNTTNCTMADALFCTVSQNNQCVQVFNSFID